MTPFATCCIASQDAGADPAAPSRPLTCACSPLCPVCSPACALPRHTRRNRSTRCRRVLFFSTIRLRATSWPCGTLPLFLATESIGSAASMICPPGCGSSRSCRPRRRRCRMSPMHCWRDCRRPPAPRRSCRWAVPRLVDSRSPARCPTRRPRSRFTGHCARPGPAAGAAQRCVLQRLRRPPSQCAGGIASPPCGGVVLLSPWRRA